MVSFRSSVCSVGPASDQEIDAATIVSEMSSRKETVLANSGSQRHRSSKAEGRDAGWLEGEIVSRRDESSTAYRSSQGPYVSKTKDKGTTADSGSPLQISEALLKLKTGTQEEKCRSQHRNPDVSRGQSGTSQTIKDRKSENITKARPGFENSSRGYARMTINQGEEGRNKAANDHLNVDAAISEVAKKVRVRVKRARLPVKPNLLQESVDEPKEKPMSYRKSCTGGVTEVSYREAAASKDSNVEVASGKRIIEKGLEEASGVLKNASLPGIPLSELGGEPANYMSGHTEIESGHNAAHGANANSQACPNVPSRFLLDQNGILDSCCELQSDTNHDRHEVPAISHPTASNGTDKIHSPEVAAVSPKSMVSQRSTTHNADGDTVLFKSMAPVSNTVVHIDGSSSKEDCTSAQTFMEENVSRENTTNELKEYPEIPPPERLLHFVSNDCSDLTAHDGAVSEPSGFEIKQLTVPETLQFPDEPPGYSLAEVSESRESQQSERTERCHLFKCFSPCTPGRGVVPEQVQSISCDAEGKNWHPDTHVEKQSGDEVSRPLTFSNSTAPEKLFSVGNFHYEMEEDCAFKEYPAPESVPYVHPSWRMPSVAENAINSSFEQNRVEKERSVFIGCIPEGIENVQEALQSLMEKFLGRFDFVPSILSHIQVVKVIKDYGFVEFAMDRVAQIVLAANQVDAFDWGMDGLHFNIEGCNGTYTSVRPLVESMPLKPARVILVGNIPELRWEEEYLRDFFCKILQGSDESPDMKLVASVHLLPESFDAYLEFASELIADAVVYRCTKNNQILKAIGEDTFLCRHTNLIPLMSKHTSSICPQRALFVGISCGREKFKIECIRKVFEEVVNRISRKVNQHGYIEYISVQPRTDYAFFQFNSEAITDAVMDEYIENTQLFSGRNCKVSYIILRPPNYIRPGTKYRSDFQQVQSELFSVGSNQHQKNEAQSEQARWMQTGSSYLTKQGHEVGRDTDSRSDEHRNRVGSSRRFGSDPGKRVDVVMSVGSVLQPIASWNGLSSAVDCSIDSESVIVVKGLVRGLSYKLLRGALNELFERVLSNSGLLQIGMLLLRYLDRDHETANVIACLPNAEVADALLSSRKSFKLSGQELRLLPKDPRKSSHRGCNCLSLTGDEGEMPWFSDGEGNQGNFFLRSQEQTAPGFSRERKRPHLEIDRQYHSNYETSERVSNAMLKRTDICTTELYKRKRLRSASSEALKKERIRGQFKEDVQRRNGANEQNWRLSSPRRDENSGKIRRQGFSTEDKVSEVSKGTDRLKRENSGIPTQNKNAGRNSKNDYHEDQEKRFASDVYKKNPMAGNPPYLSDERRKHAGKCGGERAPSAKRLRSEVVKDGLVQNLGSGQDRHRKHHRYVQQETLECKLKPKLPSLDVPVNFRRKSKHQESSTDTKSTGMIQQGLNLLHHAYWVVQGMKLEDSL